MNVASATATALAPLTAMTARNGVAVDKGADPGSVPATDKSAEPTKGNEDPLVGRYPRVAFRFDADASRLVLLFRDPADGATVEQIPTEAALKQYKEALKDRKDGKPSLQLLVGGADGDQGRGSGDSNGPGNGRGAGVDGRAAGSASTSSPGKPAASGHTTSVHSPTVVSSSPVSTHVTSTASAGTGHVNVVI